MPRGAQPFWCVSSKSSGVGFVGFAAPGRAPLRGHLVPWLSCGRCQDVSRQWHHLLVAPGTGASVVQVPPWCGWLSDLIVPF